MPFTLEGAKDSETPKGFVLEGAKDAEEESPKKSRSTGEELGRQLGLTGRDVIEGAAAIPGMIADAPAAAINAVTPKNFYKFPEQNQALSKFLTNVGFPEPEKGSETVISDISKALVPGAGMVKGASVLANTAKGPVTKMVAKLLADNPGLQTASTVTGTGASSTGKEMGANPLVQFLLGLTGGVLPSGFASIPNAVQNTARGGSTPQQMQSVIDTFGRVGAKPSLGQATQNPVTQGVENLIAKTPVGFGPMRKKAIEQQEAIGSKVDQTAISLSPKASGEMAGRSIQSGVEEKFIPEARKVQNNLYRKLDAFIPLEKEVPAQNTISTLDKMTAPIKGAMSVSRTKLLNNPTLENVKAALEEDMAGTPSTVSKILQPNGQPFVIPGTPGKGTMPYEALKEIRTRIGEKLSSFELAPEISRTELKRLYGALSQDMESAAKSQSPEAYAAFKRANNYTKAMHDRIEKLQSVLDKSGGPEKVFNAAVNGTKEGATTFRAVMKSLPEAERKTLISTMLRRLGRATPGKQNDVGDTFSTETFLTNWNKLSQEAKDTMTGHMGLKFKKTMDDIAKVASILREGSRIYANPSGTAPVEAAIATGSALAVSGERLLQGDFLPMGVTLTTLAGIRSGGKLLTNPDFVNWVANAPTKANNATWNSYIANLSSIADENPEESPEIEALQQKLEKVVSPAKKSIPKVDIYPRPQTSLNRLLSTNLV